MRPSPESSYRRWEPSREVSAVRRELPERMQISDLVAADGRRLQVGANACRRSGDHRRPSAVHRLPWRRRPGRGTRAGPRTGPAPRGRRAARLSVLPRHVDERPVHLAVPRRAAVHRWFPSLGRSRPASDQGETSTVRWSGVAMRRHRRQFNLDLRLAPELAHTCHHDTIDSEPTRRSQRANVVSRATGPTTSTSNGLLRISVPTPAQPWAI
jgi:hypothetical protein